MEGFKEKMETKMLTLEEAKSLIRSKADLKIAGDESLLSQLPRGNWIGGTTPYFMGDEGGLMTKDKLYVERVSSSVRQIKIKSYSAEEISTFAIDGFDNGYSYILIPAFSDVHKVYANTAMRIPGIFNHPVIGWVTGVHLDDLGKVSPKVFNGQTGEVFEDKALVMHAEFADNKMAFIDIVNLFKQGDGASIVFEEDGFEAEYALVNGEKVKFSEYLKETNHDISVPLIANFNGAKINVSLRDDITADKVYFYAPVFKGIEYKFSVPVENYVEEFKAEIEKKYKSPLVSFNCIHNYLYANLEGQQIGSFTGPMTFGEIAYILLNRTMVFLTF